MKIYHYLLLIFLFLFNCSPIQIIKNDINREYLDTKFTKHADVTFDFVNQYDFDFLVNISREGIISNEKTSQAEKEKSVNSLNLLQFKKNKYLAFGLHSQKPFLEKELQFNFAANSKAGSLLKNIHYFAVKRLYHHGTVSVFSYYWLLEAYKPINSENFPKEIQPITCKINFPDGKMQIFEIRP